MNVEVIICNDGAALVMVDEKENRIVQYEILCDGPTTMLRV